MIVIENVAIPESLLEKVREFSEKEGITVDQFVSSAVVEKASAWATVEYLEERAKRGSREKFLKALNNVPKVEPDEEDKIEYSRPRRDTAGGISGGVESQRKLRFRGQEYD